MTDVGSAIDALRSPDGELDRAALEQILPYGSDFLFVDRVSRLAEREIQASFQIPLQAPYLSAHFVDLQLMPGVLIAEGLAQAASVIVRYNLARPELHHVLGLEVESARFHAPVLPGETLVYEARLGAMNRRAARLEGSARVGDKRVCRAKLTVAIVERARLRQQLQPEQGSPPHGRR